MFKEMLFRGFSKCFANEIQKEKQSAAYWAVQENMKEREKSRAECKKFEFEINIGKPMIILTNEWNNPLIGEVIQLDWCGKEHIGDPWYVMKDYLSNEETMCLSTPISFSMQKLKLLGKLNPDEICALFYEGRNCMGEFRKHPTYGREKENFFTGYDDWMIKLTQHGFFERFGEVLKQAEDEENQKWQELVQKYGKDY